MSSVKARTAKPDQQAGDRPGVDYYETDVSLDELIDLMFEDLELPDLERKRLRQIEIERLVQAERLSPQRHPRAFG